MAIIPAEEKVFIVSNSTNTTYSGSASLKAMQQWYTMDDVSSTVRPYKVFTALLNQVDTSAPDITVLEDTIGGITSYYYGEGKYELRKANAFTEDKTVVFINNVNIQETDNVMIEGSGVSKIAIRSLRDGTKANDVLNRASIEIRVYN
jgi:hypothetical protein